MKKKLLVTLGDSYTEGVGCYDMTRMPEGVKYNGLKKEDREYQEERFHRLGWPNRVGKALGFDKVLNLGLGGSSISFSAKMLVEKVVGNPNYSDFDIFIIWMGTEPTRFSFFDGYTLKNFRPSNDPHTSSFSREYLNCIKDPTLGGLNEQVFYTKVVEQVCQNNSYRLLIVNWNKTIEQFMRLYPSKYLLFPEPLSVLSRIRFQDPQDFSPICRHPNENGYKKIADMIVKGIQKYRPEFVVGPEKEEIDWEWDGSNIFPDKIIKNQPPLI